MTKKQKEEYIKLTRPRKHEEIDRWERILDGKEPGCHGTAYPKNHPERSKIEAQIAQARLEADREYGPRAASGV